MFASDIQWVAKPLLGVDLDNVLALTDDLVRRIIAEQTGIHLRREDITQFDYWRCGISKEQSDSALDAFHERCGEVEPMAEAIPVLARLSEHVTIHIVTSRAPIALSTTEGWLRRHDVPHDALSFMQDKRAAPKDLVAFVEDHGGTAAALANQGISVFLLDYPWNQGVEHKLIRRVGGWSEVEEGIAILLEATN